jgi:hypothetical protein
LACATLTTPFGGCGVGVIVGVGVMVGVSVGVGDSVGVGVIEAVGDTLGVTVRDADAVNVGVADAVGQDVLVPDGTVVAASVSGVGEPPSAEQPARNMQAASSILNTEPPILVIRIFSLIRNCHALYI